MDTFVDYSNIGKPLSEVNPNLKKRVDDPRCDDFEIPILSSHMEKRCYYCNSVLADGRRKTRDHIIPVSKYGVNDKVNIVDACQNCNVMKGNLSLEEFIDVVNAKVPTRRRRKHIISKIKLLIMYRDANQSSMTGTTIVRKKKKKVKP